MINHMHGLLRIARPANPEKESTESMRLPYALRYSQRLTSDNENQA
jgi:hypothetical protein